MMQENLPEGAFSFTCLPASWHNTPEKIVPGLRRKIKSARKLNRHIMIAYGECGTGGDIDRLLKEEQVERIDGPHCYQFYMGADPFDQAMEDALGTFFVTDYMVRHFERLIMQGMGLRKHPQLRDIYFAHYTKFLYIAQIDDPRLYKKAQDGAAELGLEFAYVKTGLGGLGQFVQDAVKTHSNS